ncbi:MAG: acyltransferase [Clostridia bacterium]|nr:acyltransferase [Clostridia bacterium]
MKERQHIYYFDYLRIIAAICVIFMHTAAGPLRGEVDLDWQFMNIITSFAFTAVPLFFMMSGYLLISSEKTADISVLMKKRLPRLVLPLCGWTVVAILWSMFLARDFSPVSLYNRILTSFHSPASAHLWYMYTLIAVYLISPVISGGIRALDKKGKIFVAILAFLPTFKLIAMLLLPTAVDQFLNFDFITKLEFFSGYLCPFIIGYALGSLEKKISNWILVPSAVVVWVIIIIGTYVRTVETGQYNQAYQHQAAGFEVLLASILFLIFKQNFNKQSWFTKRIPLVPLSLPIYLMHNILLSMMFSVGFSNSNIIKILFMTFLNLVICFFVMKTVATIKPLCFIATGMPYKEACNTCNWVYTYRWIKEALSKRKQ